MRMKNHKEGMWEDCVTLAGINHVREQKNIVSKLNTQVVICRKGVNKPFSQECSQLTLFASVST
jgi:hypothetical protein